jgi:hypothetical protein
MISRTGTLNEVQACSNAVMQPASWDVGGFDSGHLSGYSINPFDEPTFTSVLASNRPYGSFVEMT